MAGREPDKVRPKLRLPVNKEMIFIQYDCVLYIKHDQQRIIMYNMYSSFTIIHVIMELHVIGIDYAVIVGAYSQCLKDQGRRGEIRLLQSICLEVIIPIVYLLRLRETVTANQYCFQTLHKLHNKNLIELNSHTHNVMLPKQSHLHIKIYFHINKKNKKNKNKKKQQKKTKKKQTTKATTENIPCSCCGTVTLTHKQNLT